MPSLHERQKFLVAYLLDPERFMNVGGKLDGPLVGLDKHRLKLIGISALRKRKRKIKSALPKTYQLLGDDTDALFAQFTAKYPQTKTNRYNNAEQFFNFLSSIWNASPPDPSFLPDVVNFEIAVARAHEKTTHQICASEARPEPTHTHAQYRRRPGLQTLQCKYEIRPLFANDNKDIIPVLRDNFLAIFYDDVGGIHKVFEVPQQAHNLLQQPDNLAVNTEDDTVLVGDLLELGIIEQRG